MEYLTKAEAEERFRFDQDTEVYCPDCMTKLRQTSDASGEVWYCPNEMCLNDEQGKLGR